jgi:dTDP-4-amino-4,6-dideoxygalactose transaminase
MFGMLDTRFPPWPSFTEDEIAAVSRVLRSGRVNYWTGEEARAFEKEFSEWTGARYAIALANGTVALDLALRSLGIGPGDEVIVTPRSFMASASCVVNAGAIPVFADVDRDSGNLSAEMIRAALTPRTRAVIVVHLAGWPCDMEPIMELAAERGLRVVEDCAQAHGARYRGRSVGTIGDVGAWSFCQDKIMTTGGEGGMVTTDDRDLWSRMWSFKDHGKSWEAVYEREHAPGFRWLHESFGTNWRMTEMQAAIGRIQLRRMAEWTVARNRNAEAIAAALAPFAGPDGAVRIPEFRVSNQIGGERDTGSSHAKYKYYVYVRREALSEGWSRDRIVQEITTRGVPCFQGSCSEIYLEPAFEGTRWRPERSLSVARELGETSLMFLVHPTLAAREIELTGDAIREVLAQATRAARPSADRPAA